MSQPRHIPMPGEFYRHFKDKLYQIITIATYAESNQQLVIYQAMYGDYRVYARTQDNFMEKVDKIKYPNAEATYRFEQVFMNQGDMENREKVIELVTEVTEETVVEPVEEQTPEPVEEQTPEPVEEQTPDPMEEQTPDPMEEQTPDPMEELTPAAKEASIQNAILSNTSIEGNPLMEFLEARSYKDKIEVLDCYRNRLTDKVIDAMAISMDCVYNGKTCEEKLEELRRFLVTKNTYEKEPR